ncbi:response regulator [Paenibacillus nasutitermitis]|uniref:AraC family transcriptional regulator n=1 Tax=Paenibacillus nasutitermitis TaxID=1652958 RepID=A0A917DPA9_9BACL|nr:response regulator [Paenibacillus nasutitermitis]GGD53695.1 AraC family transcriptional regulator [Paenibacillus nasutitermitis]
MRILIVDDETLIRQHLSSLEEWESLQCAIVGEAANGREALELIPLVKPQLVITDIRMPEMDGIELAGMIRRIYPHIHVMFISAYDDFEYAKQAMKLGVCDFITKPIQVSEMIDSVELLQQGILRMNEDERLEREKAISLLLSEDTGIMEAQNLLVAHHVQDRSIQVILVEIDNADLMHLSERPLSFIVLRELVDHRLQDQPQMYWTYLDRSGIYIVLFAADDMPLAGGVQSMQIANQLLDEIGKLSGYSLSIGISRPLPSAAELREGFRQSKQCMEYRMLLGKGSIISYEALIGLEKGRMDKEDKAMTELLMHIRRGDGSQIPAALRVIYREMLAAGLDKKVIQHYALEVLTRADQMLEELHIPIPPESSIDAKQKIFSYSILSDLLEFLSGYLSQAAYLIAQQSDTGTPSIIRRIHLFLEQHYKEDVTLASLSAKLHMNHSYLSRLIKKQTGVHFRDLLWKHRIDKAKELMRQQELKTFEIAYELGFKDPSHFSQVFKRMVGVSPSDYRASLPPT